MTIPNGSGTAAPAAPRAAAPQQVQRRPAAPPPTPPAVAGYEQGAEQQWGGAPATRSGLVTAIAVTNFVLGGLSLVCGLIGLLFASWFTGAGAALASATPVLVSQVPQAPEGMPKFEMPKIDNKQFEEAAKKAFGETRAAASGVLGFLGTLIMILSLLNILWGGAAIAGGIGLLKRQNWGRLVTLVLAGVAGFVGILYIVTIFMGAPLMSVVLNVLLYLGYAGFVFFVLLKPEIRAEFA
jgi:hypothetical protein